MAGQTETTARDRAAAFLATQPTAILVDAVRKLDGTTDQWERISLAWTTDELERRYPALLDWMEAWVDSIVDLPVGRADSYGVALLRGMVELGIA